MSGIREHKVFTVKISGEHSYIPRDAYGEVCGETIREKFDTTKIIIASLPSIAEAHVRHWLQFSGAHLDTVTVNVNEGIAIDAFIEEHVW